MEHLIKTAKTLGVIATNDEETIKILKCNFSECTKINKKILNDIYGMKEVNYFINLKEAKVPPNFEPKLIILNL